MIDIMHVTELLAEMARRIESFDGESAGRLKLLNAAIQDEASGEINAWADSDLYQLIDPALVCERYRSYQARPARSRVELNGRTLLRILLPCLPLLLTGVSLIQALTLYPAVLAASPAGRGSQSFLFWWQQGFNGQLPGWLRASNVLLLDLLLLLAWLISSLWLAGVPSLQQQQSQEQARQEQDLRAALNHTLAMVTLYLAHYKSQLSTADNLTLLARRIDSMGRRLETNFEQVSASFDSMTRQVSERFAGIAQELTREFDGVTTDITTRYDGMSQQVMHRFGQMTDRMLEQLLEGSKYLKEMDRLSGGVVQTADHVRAAATILQQTNGELTRQAQNLALPTAELARQQASLITAASQSTQLLQEISHTMTDLSQQQDRWGTDLRNILDTLDLTIERAAELALQYTHKEEPPSNK
ncbi:hypothetical protein KDH_48360 [Dictyobacter sp. S3.2.2.5]|uniref:Methyl-accepting chemotaxis protein n=1 Tax=Dictyobacter halimunensis TaxID=3026934 RepID=A0ABQ6FYC2_9CHLR|nr:hypothetical protein KDH_48360 [Dictyobacter sp. S3.2.2.5]